MSAVRLLAGGTILDILTRDHLLRRVTEALLGDGVPLVVASSNLDHLTHFGVGSRHEDPAAGRGEARWLVTADGIPIVWWARRQCAIPVEQLAGSDLLPAIVGIAEEVEARVGFLGGWPEQHERLSKLLAEAYPSLSVAGFWGPTREALEDPAAMRHLAAEVRTAGVDLLVVGLGKPRQEIWLANHVHESGAKVALAFGAAADFMTGQATRAPRLLQRAGLEWLFRLVKEPRRLWRRYLVEGPRALRLLVTFRQSG